MNILAFHKQFKTEEDCRTHFRLQREKKGITCKNGCNVKHYWYENQGYWKCSKCSSRTNLRAGSMMENSKLPFMYWYITIHLMTSTKKSFSALEIQRQLGHNRYEPIWAMMNKIRMTMGKRDAIYTLKGDMEMDDAFFEVVEAKGNAKPENLSRGRGSERQAEVLVMVESKPVEETSKHKPKRVMRYIKMQVIDDVSSESINYEVFKGVDEKSNIVTDGWRGYSKLKELVNGHQQEVVPPKEAGKVLPWVHISISNAKRLLLNTHHSIGRAFLQNYLNEFCYKLNRRYMNDNLFDRLIVAGCNDTWY